MNFLITGGTGLIGRHLIQYFLRQSDSLHQFLVVSRQAENTLFKYSNVSAIDSLTLLNDLNDIDVVVNLQGEPMFGKRWTKSHKNKLCQSRWAITQKLTELIQASDNAPSVFISSSAIGYYGRQGSNRITEDFRDCFNEFSHRLCEQWEKNALLAQSETTRVCILRTGIVLSKDGGALSQMLPSFKLGLGGTIASGSQMMSWIHINDMINLIVHCIENKNIIGSVNATAPYAVSNKEFSQTLANQLHRPCIFSMPKFVIQLLFGEVSDLLVYGQNVVPQKLIDNNFEFNFPKLELALSDLFKTKPQIN